MSKESHVLDGYRFAMRTRIQPEMDPNGDIQRFMPQERYAKAAVKRLDLHGGGPFCRFSAPGLPVWTDHRRRGGIRRQDRESRPAMGVAGVREDFVRKLLRRRPTHEPQDKPWYSVGRSGRLVCRGLGQRGGRPRSRGEPTDPLLEAPVERPNASRRKRPSRSRILRFLYVRIGRSRTSPRPIANTARSKLGIGTTPRTAGKIRARRLQERPLHTRPVFQLTLYRTYYTQGFFNIPQDFDRYVRSDEGAVTLELGSRRQEIEAEANRSANKNGTARIMGRTLLRRWFQAEYRERDIVPVRFDAPDRLVLG